MAETGDGVHFVHFWTMGAVTDTPRSSTSPRRLRSRLAAGGFALLTAGAGLGFADTPLAGAATTTSVAFGREIVTIDNRSGYTDLAVQSLTRRADNSMGTQNPAAKPGARGQMSNGDRVVVTDGGLYWLDIKDRGGLLSGMWKLNSSGEFADFPRAGWSPNYFAPGSDGNANTRPYDNGQYVSVIPTGGVDGNCDLAKAGTGKFVISNSNLCGRKLGPASTAQPSVVDSAYTFSGTLYEAGTGAKVMKDGEGNSSTVGYALIYRFTGTSVQTELVLTPASTMNLTTVVVGGVSDYATSTVAKKVSISNRERVHFTDNAPSCGPSRNVLVDTPELLCTTGLDGTNFVIRNTDDYESIQLKTNVPLVPGDYVTARQSLDGGVEQRRMTYTVPTVDGAIVPQSIDHVWNKDVRVIALDADFVNSKFVPTSSTAPFKGAFDITMAGR